MAFEELRNAFPRTGGRARCSDCGEEAAGRIQTLAQEYVRGEGRPVKHIATTSLPFCETHLKERWRRTNDALTGGP